jgi:hypothetical protein
MACPLITLNVSRSLRLRSDAARPDGQAYSKTASAPPVIASIGQHKARAIRQGRLAMPRTTDQPGMRNVRSVGVKQRFSASAGKQRVVSVRFAPASSSRSRRRLLRTERFRCKTVLTVDQILSATTRAARGIDHDAALRLAARAPDTPRATSHEIPSILLELVSSV